MEERQVLAVQQGVWIDEQWIREAGLGPQLRVVIRLGEIRIVPDAENTSTQVETGKGWDVFRQLGDNAPVGSLLNAATEHDRHLYGKTS